MPATVGELAWMWGKGHADLGSTWRHRLWLSGGDLAGEFEPVGTHQGYRRRGLARSVLQHGMQRAAQAGATEMLVACLGAPAHTAAGALYYDIGFRPFTRDLPHVKPAR